MALHPGTRLGPYEIVAALGAGGMGEVYRARDTRLHRDVAIKVLPPAFAADPERAHRFDREAQAISRLSHPNICTLYDIGQSNGSTYLVMELLRGETLRDRLNTGPLPIDLAIQTGIEIATALEVAHRQGIVHRDLKPANIMLTKTGVKLLDFGLAKEQLTLQRASDGTTILNEATTPGLMLGTLQYMAPEQLEGRDVDARADVFAAGAVLYEMVTGRKAFESGSDAGVISAILRAQPPPIDTLQPAVPAILTRVIETSLAKDPDERWQSAGELRHALAWMSKANVPITTTATNRPWGRAALGLLVGALAGAVGTALVLLRAPDSTSVTRNGVFRLQFDVSPADAVLGSNPSLERSYGYRRPSRTALAVAPDGRAIVFTGERSNVVDLYVRRFDQGVATVLPETTGAESPFFSPDGKWIGFWQGNKLRKSLVEGGSPVDICTTPRITGASWTASGFIVFAARKLFRVADAGGQPEELASPDAAAGEGHYQLPIVLPGGQFLLYTATTGAPTLSDSRIVIRPMSGGPARTLVEDASDGRYVEPGHLVFARSGALFAAPFDPVRGVVTGGAVNVVADVMHAVNVRNEELATNAAQFAFSKGGHLAYLAGGASPDPVSRLVWAGPTSTTPIAEIAGTFSKARISPDGRRILIATRGRERALKVYDLARGTLATVGVHGSVQVSAEWLTDNRIVFAGVSKGFTNIFVVPADGSAPADRLTTAASDQHVASVSPDGREVLFVQDGDIWVLTVAARTTRRLFATPFAEQSPTFSPDGRWIAYEGYDGGRAQVYVRPYPGLGQRIAVGGEGRHPRWSRDGRRFFYMTDRPSGESVITEVDVDIRTGLPTGRSRVMWSGATADYVGGTFVHAYDVTNDGGRILAVRLDPQPAMPIRTINIVLNWTEELKRLVPSR